MSLQSLRQAARIQVRDDARNSYYLLDNLVPRLLFVTLESLQDEIQIHDRVDEYSTYEDILVIEVCLRKPEQVDLENSSLSSATALQDWTIQALLPSSIFSKQSQFDPIPSRLATKEEIARWQAMAAAGLHLLSHLHSLAPHLKQEPSVALYQCLAAFTDPEDQWNTPEAFREAQILYRSYLDTFEDEPSKTQALVTRTLNEKVRPLFARTKNLAITPQGRKAIQPLPGELQNSESEAEAKPWKFRNLYIVTVFRWIVLHLDACMVQGDWPLLIPPLLALLDDETTAFKVKGCELLTHFLAITPPSVLQRTGLGQVFHEVLMPCLSYLPILTPEGESLFLLRVVYPALIILTRVRFSEHADRRQKMHTLDKILRLGVIKGYAHAGENVKIAELLVQKMEDLVKEMGIMSVKHMKDLVPLLSGILSAPFAIAYSPLLLAANQALQAIILNDWPRIENYFPEILKGLTICWCRLEAETQSGSTTPLHRAIRTTLKLLQAAINDDSYTARAYGLLKDSDPRLQNLLLP